MKNFLHTGFLYLLFHLSASADNAPITAAASITNATTSPGGVTVPITVKDFTDIGQLQLTLKYTTAYLTYVSYTYNSAFSGLFFSNTTGGGTGTIVITWLGSAGITLPDQTHLLDITFTYISHTSSVYWDYSNCFYKKYAGGSFTPCNDLPSTSYYIKGGVSARGAPVAYAPVLTNVSAGTCLALVTVTGFSTVGAFSLYLEYDPAILTFDSCTPNGSLGGIFNANANNIGGRKFLIVSWSTTSPVSLTDGNTLFTVKFTFSTSNGGFSTLNWFENYENGPSCAFSDDLGIYYLDSPSSCYYRNGIINNHDQNAPVVMLPVITNASSSGTTAVPVVANDFTNICSFTLSFEYDPAVLTYTGYAAHSSLSAGFSVVNNPPGGNGKSKLVMTWSGSGTSLPNSSILVTLNFSYISGTSFLKWVTDAASCRFNDANGNAYFDLPKKVYYQDGAVCSHAAPKTIAWYASPPSPQQVTIPVKVKNFSNIGYFSLNLFYDPGVLTYVSCSLVPSLGGSFSSSLAGPGKMGMTWSGSATSLADSSTLLNLIFNYLGGSNWLVWYDTDTTSYCQYAEGATMPYLYDQPLATYYVNGFVSEPGLWTGATSSAWNTASNWNNNKVPTAMTVVQIPSSAPNWPQFTGDLTLGTQCKNITMDGNSQLTVSGNFTVSSGSVLTFTGSGTLKIGGNWYDAGSFVIGTGTVEFFGSTPASILSPVNETFYHLIENKTGVALTIPHTVNVNGNLIIK